MLVIEWRATAMVDGFDNTGRFFAGERRSEKERVVTPVSRSTLG